MANKGAQFERHICKKLSLWWTDGERDDVFWRTSGSGARATTRGKKGKETFGQHSDVQATDPIGQPLIDLVSIEIKRGYSKHTLSDIIERKPNSKPSSYEQFMNQAQKESLSRQDGSSWMLVVKRDRREAVLFIPFKLWKQLWMSSETCPAPSKICPSMLINAPSVGGTVIATPFTVFLNYISPEAIISEVTHLKYERRTAERARGTKHEPPKKSQTQPITHASKKTGRSNKKKKTKSLRHSQE
jgi:hypothetical protein